MDTLWLIVSAAFQAATPDRRKTGCKLWLTYRQTSPYSPIFTAWAATDPAAAAKAIEQTSFQQRRQACDAVAAAWGAKDPAAAVVWAQGLPNSEIAVTLEIQARVPSVPDYVARTVSENCRTLKFKSQSFEPKNGRSRAVPLRSTGAAGRERHHFLSCDAATQPLSRAS